ncbi:DUF4238 domain-containing protein [Arthrobacter sp. HY1533]|uniref:DUF4238 domain-containing protein n=1 Tax=Arthrobacter sp. HY1533 TaxID=2970919 RepID=UPI0022B9E93A|nr:DUF4238 domain-containing protein [Arthrobacter sp. HY1533]
MGKPELVRKQHVVSKFYLKGFADSSNRLRRTLLPGYRSHLISVERASVVKDFYTIELEDGQLSDYFERAFSDVEGPAGAVLKSVVGNGGWPLSAEEKCDLALWIALQHLRSEGVRTQGNNINALMIQLVVGTSGKEALRRHIENAESAPISSERLDFEWAELTRDGGPRLRADARSHLRMVGELLEPTATMLASMQWSVNVYKRKHLVTGDHPVSLLKTPQHPPFFGVGLANAGGFALPLSRTHGLVIGASPDLPDLRMEGTALTAKSMNQATATNSRTCLYSHPDDENVIRGMHVPEVREREVSSPSAARFVKEEGLFGHLSDSDRNSLPASLDGGDSFSLDDLEWPIPNRLVIWDDRLNDD